MVFAESILSTAPAGEEKNTEAGGTGIRPLPHLPLPFLTSICLSHNSLFFLFFILLTRFESEGLILL